MEQNISALFTTIKDIEQAVTDIDQNLSFPIQNDQEHLNDIRSLLSVYRAKLKASEEQIVVLNCKIDGLRNGLQIKEQQLARDNEEKIKKQKKEFEEIMERQVAFIDTIVKEKKELLNKIALMKQEKVETEKNTEKKLKEMEDKQKQNMKNVKEAWRAAEKLNRDKWMQETTARIKEITIKGMEPQIMKLDATYKQQINTIRKQHEEEIEKLKVDMAREYDERLNKLKLEITNMQS